MSTSQMSEVIEHLRRTVLAMQQMPRRSQPFPSHLNC